MVPLDRYRIRVRYKGLEGLSEMGFKRREVLVADLFPTADELILSMKAYFHRVDGSASIIYEVPGTRFNVAEDHQFLELAVPAAQGDYIGLIIDTLALDVSEAGLMMEDIETTCGLVRARFGDALGIMEMSEDDYVHRLRDSMRLLANELRC
jgi:hypothetical protein